ncbi:MAG: hypothetical protein JNM84_13640 [Planctomycetes bacterium]|nr:hypothetical protein [Planctomycetota bacterium]
MELLRAHFVPVALDQAYERREQDAWGEFYRAFAKQGPRADMQATTQGFYVATAAGELLLYNNNRNPEKLLRLLREARERFASSEASRVEVAPRPRGEREARYAPRPPEGGLVLRVRSQVLGGYPEPTDEVQRAMQRSLGRDNLWLTRDEHAELARGAFPASALERLARFHFVDNTRGEPPMWAKQEVRTLHARIVNGVIEGRFELATEKDAGEARRYHGELRGRVEVRDGVVTRCDLVALGGFRGEGRYTQHAPPGEFPFAVAFELADGQALADAIPPQGSRGWVDGYLRPR